MLLEQIMRSARGLPMLRGVEFGNPLTPGPRASNIDDIRAAIAQLPNDIAPQPDMSPEPVRVNAPVTAPQAPSVPVPAGAYPVDNRKRRGGILGALESVFMPEPDSLWASALRNGVWDAKAGQQKYRQEQALYGQEAATKELERQTAEAKLKKLIRGGEIQVVGNNIARIGPNGEVEFITPPQNPTETQRLIDMWKAEPNNDVKELIRGILLKGNDPAIIALKGQTQADVAEARAAANARHRAPPKSGGRGGSSVSVPSGWVVEK